MTEQHSEDRQVINVQMIQQ